MSNRLGHGIALAAALTLTACCPAPQDQPFWAAGLGDAAARFELARRSEPELIAFLRRMPKGADLHNHLSGATYSDYLLDSAKAQKLNYDLATNKFTDTKPGGQVITVDALIQNSVYLARYLDIYSMRGWHPNANNGHDLFFATFGYASSAKRSDAQSLAEVIRRNLYQSIQYVELMTSTVPKELTDALDKALLHFAAARFGPEQLEDAFVATAAIREDERWRTAVQEFIGSRERQAFALLGEATRRRMVGNDPDLVVRYIPQLYRTKPLKDFFRDAVAAMMSIGADPRVVAVNMVQAEDDPRSRWQFDAQMKILDYLWVRMGKPNVSLHAGELALAVSPVEPMWNRIRDSIALGHARRIGHGVSIAWSRDVAALLTEMRERQVLVEICLTSNESILGVSGSAHPFMLYRRAGVPVSLNTDDEGVSRSLLTVEYAKAVERYSLSYEDVKDLARNSVEYSFLPGEGLYRARDYRRLRPEFVDVRAREWRATPGQQALMAKDAKLAQAVRLERAFLDFERNLAEGFLEP